MRYNECRSEAVAERWVRTTGATNTYTAVNAAAAKQHKEAAHQFEGAAKMHHDAAKQCASGYYEKAESLATSSAEAEGVANRHAMQAVDSYRHQAQAEADRKAEADAEEDARIAKHEAKAAKQHG